MPWKNGLGSTTEIIIDPPGSSIAENNFEWRLSSATLNSAGPFSQFKGYDRYLTLIDGTQVRLTIDGNVKTLKLHEVIKFSGDQQVVASKPDWTFKDLGLIFQRDLIDAQFHFLSAKKVEQLTTGTYIVFACNGSTEVKIDKTFEKKLTVNQTAIVQVKKYELAEMTITPDTESLFVIIKIFAKIK